MSSTPTDTSFVCLKGFACVHDAFGANTCCLPLLDIDRSAIEVQVIEPSGTRFRHKHSIAPPTRLISYKARYPYLVTLSGTESKAFLFNIEEGKLEREYTLNDVPEPAYVELDQWSLFLAGSTLSIVDRSNGFVHKLLDTSIEDARDETWTTRWTAVHHSLDGRHLVVVGDANELVWIRDYRSILTDVEDGVDHQKLAENSIMLRLEENPGEVLIENLCVENDRGTYRSTYRYPCQALSAYLPTYTAAVCSCIHDAGKHVFRNASHPR